MFGLMVVFSFMRFLVLHLQSQGSLLVYVLMLGDTVAGGILMVLVSLWMAWLHPVEVFSLFLVTCRLFRGLNFWGYSCFAGF